jgi:hypothetical protein
MGWMECNGFSVWFQAKLGLELDLGFGGLWLALGLRLG